MAEATELRQLVQLQRGQSYKGALLGEPGPFLLGLGTIQRNGGFRGENLKTYGGVSPVKTLLRAGDLYVSLKDVTHSADLLGAVARVPIHVELGRLTQDTIRLDVDDTRVDRDYLYWLLRTPEFREYCRARGTGTTNLDLSREDFLAYKVVLPSRASQRATAELLEALDDKIAANTKLSVTASALMVSLLTPYPVKLPLSAIVVHRRKSTNPESVSDKNVAHFSLPAFDTDQCPEVCNPASIKSNKFLIEKPSVLISKLNPRFPRIWDVTTLPDIPALASTEFLVLEPKEESTAVIWAMLSHPSFSASLESQVSGTSSSHQRVKPNDLLATLVPDPGSIPIAVRRQIAALGSRVSATRIENITLAATRDALLPQLMSGKLRVKEAELLVEAAL